tara:strand:- start:272 stop:1621 length:1350 start_codon:yes stop_codon:yes gene_type:complete
MKLLKRLLIVNIIAFLFLLLYSLDHQFLIASAYKIFYSHEEINFEVIKVPYHESKSKNKSIELDIALHKAPSLFYQSTLFINTGGPSNQVKHMRSVIDDLPNVIKATHDIIMFNWRLHSKNTLSIKMRECIKAKNCESFVLNHAKDIGTLAAVNDLEFIRQKYHIEHISLLGFSYGAVLFTHYAALYPQYIDALILDSPYFNQTKNLDELDVTNINWHAKIMYHKFKTLGYDYDEYLSLINSVNWEKNIVNLPKNRAINLDGFQERLDLFNEHEVVNTINMSQSIENNIILDLILCADQPQSIQQKEEFNLTKLELFKAGILLEDIDHLDQSTCPIGITQQAILPKIKPKSIVLNNPSIIVYSDFDPVISPDKVSELSSLFEQHYKLSVQNSGFHGLFKGTGSLCIDKKLTKYLLTKNLESKSYLCNLAEETKKYYKELSSHLNIFGFE